MIDTLIDFLFPKRCYGCGIYGIDLCNDCFKELSIADQICPQCGEDSLMGWTHPGCITRLGMDGLVAIYDHQDPKVKAIINGVKFDFNKELIKRVLNNFRFETGVMFDYLVPVPLHFYRQNWRGFNQAEETALVVGEEMKVAVSNVLRRGRKTGQQSKLSSKEEREKNVKGAFEVLDKDKKRLKGKRVMLIDDVFTSGADMRECTKALKIAGAKLVWGFALAH